MIRDLAERIRDWIKATVLKLLRRADPALTPHRNIELEQKLARAIQKKRVGRAVDTRRGGPNMPWRQPCTSCHRSAKRKRKTMGGAYYRCPIHGEFFVRAPGL